MCSPVSNTCNHAQLWCIKNNAAEKVKKVKKVKKAMQNIPSGRMRV